MNPRNDIPVGLGAQLERADECNAKMAVDEACAPSLRDRLERKRTRLQRELAKIDAALSVLYTVPDAERIAAVLQQANF